MKKRFHAKTQRGSREVLLTLMKIYPFFSSLRLCVFA